MIAEIDLDLMSVDQLFTLAFLGILGVMGLFGLAALVRLWAGRLQKTGPAGSGLDLAKLKQHRDEGLITPEEYEAIRNRLAGVAPAATGGGAAPAGDSSGRSIEQTGGPQAGPEGSGPHGKK